jgi:hypothetical protein
MERIASLIEQLQQAVSNKADAAQMLVLTNMLQAELEKQLTEKNGTVGTQRVAVVLPSSRNHISVQLPVEAAAENMNAEKQDQTPVKVIEVLQVDEAEVEAELEEIRLKAEFAKKIQSQQTQHKPALLFEDEPEVPTLIHHPNYKAPEKTTTSKELNEMIADETKSVNDQLNESTKEVAHKITETAAVKDLKKAIGINDRFVFINELFRGDDAMYERSIKTINNFSAYPEAQYWMERELKIKLGWDDSRPSTKEFYNLVKRRFS